MAAAVKSPGKTAFVKDVLTKNPQANPEAVNKAWNEAGHDGTISTTLVQKLRSEMGLTGNVGKGRKPAGSNGATKKRGRPPGSKKAGSKTETNGAHAKAVTARVPKVATKNDGRSLEELEGELDRLIFKTMGMGGLTEVEETLRKARRLVVRSHQG